MTLQRGVIVFEWNFAIKRRRDKIQRRRLNEKNHSKQWARHRHLLVRKPLHPVCFWRNRPPSPENYNIINAEPRCLKFLKLHTLHNPTSQCSCHPNNIVDVQATPKFDCLVGQYHKCLQFSVTLEWPMLEFSKEESYVRNKHHLQQEDNHVCWGTPINWLIKCTIESKCLHTLFDHRNSNSQSL